MRERIHSFLTEVKNKSTDIRSVINATGKKNAVEVINQLLAQLDGIHREFNSLNDVKINEFLDFFVSQLSALHHYLSLEDHNFSVEKTCATVVSAFIKSGQDILNNLQYKRAVKNIENDGKKAGIASRPDNLNDEQKRVDQQNDLDKDPGFASLLRSVWLDATEKQLPSKRIFISYAWPRPEPGVDEAWSKPFVEKLAFHLVLVGFQVYLDEFQSGAGYSLAQFMKDIRKADHVIVVSSRTMKEKLLKPESGVNFERNEIIDHLRQIADLLPERFIIPVLLNHSNYCHPDFSDLAEVPVCSGGYLNAIMELIRRIYGFPAHDFRNWWHVGLKKHEIIKNLWNVPIKNPNFILRDKTADLQAHFTTGDLRPLALTAHGLGGVGKTQLVVDYVYQNFYLYDEVCWFSASTRDELEQEYLLFGLVKKIKGVENKEFSVQERAQLVKKDLEAKGGQLLVYDNTLNYDDIKDLLPATTSSNHILITSRNIKWEGKCIEVGVFSLGEAKRYIKQVIQDDRSKDVENSEILINELGNLPLALAQACAFLSEEHDISIAQYLRLYRSEKRKLLQENRLPARESHDAVFVTWNITLERIRKESSTAELVLQCCAFLNPENIPESLLYEFLSQSGIQSAVQQRGDINLLHQYSMIQRDNQHRSASVHRLVQDVIVLSIKSEIKIQVIKHIFCALNIIFERYDQPSYILARIYQHHLDAIQPYAIQPYLSEEQVAAIYIWQAALAAALCDINATEKYTDKLKKINALEGDMLHLKVLLDRNDHEKVILFTNAKLNSSYIHLYDKIYQVNMYLFRAKAYMMTLLIPRMRRISVDQSEKNRILKKVKEDLEQAKKISISENYNNGIINVTIECGKISSVYTYAFTTEEKKQCINDLKELLKNKIDFTVHLQIKFALAKSLWANGENLEALEYGLDLLRLARESEILQHYGSAHRTLSILYGRLDFFKADAHCLLTKLCLAKNEHAHLHIGWENFIDDINSLNYFLSRGLNHFLFNRFNEAIIEFSKIINGLEESEVIAQYEEPQKEIFDKYLQVEIENRGALNVEVKLLAYYYLVKSHLGLNNIQAASEVVNQFSNDISKKHKPINFRLLSYAYHLLGNTDDAILEAAFADSLENTAKKSKVFHKSDEQRQSACSTGSTVSADAAQQQGIFSQSASSSTGAQQVVSGDRQSSSSGVLSGHQLTPTSK